jgi:hypothetical protein
VTEAFRRKRKDYLHNFIRNRALKTLVHFDLAVVLYLLLAIILGHKFLVQQYVLCWIGWLSIGNSNWFIFDIIVLYVLSYVGMNIVERKQLSIETYGWIVLVFSCCFLILLFRVKELWWYDTLLAYPVGTLWSVYREKIEQNCSSSRKYWFILAVMSCIFIISMLLGRNYKTVFLVIASPIFGVIITLLSMKSLIGNVVLDWLGKHAFAIYITQRLAMITAAEYDLNQVPFVFVAIVLPATLAISSIFMSMTNRIDRKFFS